MAQSFPEPEFPSTDRFVIERQLGSGGFGVVYAAYDRKQNVRVAIKLLRRGDAGSLYRFKQEFRALAGLTHPNLIGMYELLNEGADWFFTMELVHGVDFLTYVGGGRQIDEYLPNTSAAFGEERQVTVTLVPDPNASRSRVDLARLRAATAQLVRGLCALHQAGMLHRDLKPSNVLVDSTDRVVILDFGLVSELSPEVEPTAAGTPGFMAPEQKARGTVTQASDWYSVGVMLYEALTGRRPPRDSAALPPSDFASGVPDDLDKLVYDLLQVDPGSRPSGAEVLVRLQIERPVPAAAQSSFVGRAEELQTLRAAYGAAMSQPVVVLVHGGSGIGKSALVSHFLARLKEDHPEAIVLTGRCYQRESVPHKAIDSLIDALARYLKRLRPLEAEGLMPRDIAALAQLFPVLRQVESVASARRRPVEAPDAQEQRRRAFSALKELLARIADGSPLVMCIDDLHWGDLDSLSPLVDMVSPPDPPGLLLLSCYRSEEAGSSLLLKSLLPAWRNLRPSVDVREMAVPELGPEEAREMVRALAGQHRPGAAQFVEQVVQESGGNPFWITELTQRQDTDGKAPAHLDQVVMERVSQIPEAARRLLDVIAVSGAPVETKVAFRAAGLESNDPQLLPLLYSSHFVRERSTEELETYHDRIRQTLVASLNPAAARDCHLRLALALEAHANARDPETLAVHFHAGGDPARAAGYAAEAASQAARALAFDRAVRLYRLALERPDSSQSSVAQLQMGLGDSLSNLGRGDEAAQAYLAGAERAPDPEERLELRRRAAEQLLLSGQVDAGLAVLRDVLQSVGMKLPKTPHGALLWAVLQTAWLEIRGIGFRARDAGQLPLEDLIAIDACGTVALGLATIDPIRALAFSVRQVLLALKAGEPSRVSRALSMQAGFEGYIGSRRRSRVDLLLREARKLADQTRNPLDHALTTMITLVVHFHRGEWKKTKQSEPEWKEWSARARAALPGQPGPVLWEWATVKLTSYGALHFMGDFGELSRQIPLLIRDAEERCDRFTLTNARCRFLPIVYLAADRPRDARRELDRAVGDWSLQGFYLQHYFHEYAAGEVDLYSGEPGVAWDRMRRLWKGMRRSFLSRPQVFAIEARHLRARAAIAVAAQGRDEGEMISDAEREAGFITRQRTPWGDHLALLIRAGVASLRGRMDEAAKLLEAAESGLEEAGMMHYLAASRRRRGEILGGAVGSALIAAAESYYAQQGVKNTARMTDALAPGRWTGMP